MNDEPIIDVEWRAIAAKAKDLIPNDDDINRDLLEGYQQDGEAPKGCSITNGTDPARNWVAKMYIGGKQRVLGYGTCYQCARLYDAVYWRFRKYRTHREELGQIYNFGEDQAGDDNINADTEVVPCEMEALLLKRGVLKTSEQREQAQRDRKAEYQAARYTSKGRMEGLIERLFVMVEAMGEQFEKLNRRLDNLAKGIPAPVPLQYKSINVEPQKIWEINPAWKDGGPGYVGDDPRQTGNLTCGPIDATCNSPESV